MRIEGLEQNSPEWVTHRIGMVTASRVGDVMDFLKKGGESAARRNYKTEKVIECLTLRAAEHYVTPAMEFGLETEPLAVAAYEMANDLEAEDGGFWVHDSISRFGASPDRLIGPDGLLEVKCPTTAVHLEYLIGGVVPDQYKPQMLAEMACTGREWVDFVSYDPRLPKRLQMFIRRFPRDEKAITNLENGVIQFLEEVAAILLRLAGDGDLTAVLEKSVGRARVEKTAGMGEDAAKSQRVSSLLEAE